MGFFGTFWTWLDGRLATYIGENTARLAAVLEPAVVTLATVYVMAWGYLHLTGRIEEPVVTGLKRIALVAVVLGAGLRLWLYNSLIVDTFYTAPSQLAAAITGSQDPVATVDVIWERGGAVAGIFWSRTMWSPVMAVAVWAVVGVLCIYVMFLIALSHIALAVLLALGPLFFTSLLFGASRRFFAAWISQLANYALITILTIMIAAILLQVVESFAAQTAARGQEIKGVDVLDLLLAAVVVFLILRQVMPIAASLAGGIALNSFGTLSRTLGTAMGPRGTHLKATAIVGARAAAGVSRRVTGMTAGFVHSLNPGWSRKPR